MDSQCYCEQFVLGGADMALQIFHTAKIAWPYTHTPQSRRSRSMIMGDGAKSEPREALGMLRDCSRSGSPSNSISSLYEKRISALA